MRDRRLGQASSDSLGNLRGRLGARWEELEQAALTRITAIADPAQVSDPSYVVGLREALAAALNYGLGMVESGGETLPPIPVVLLAQARMAARAGVSLNTVLRRYAAGHGLLADSLLDEAAAAGVGAAELKGVLRDLAARYDRIVTAVSEEYGREAASQPPGTERRRYALVRRLLAGEPLDASGLGYGLEGYHLAIVASGTAAAGALERLGEHIDRRRMLVVPEEQAAWAWLGGRRPIDAEEQDLLASFPWPKGSAVACGEPGRGLAGWRLSHRQAAAALPVAQRAAKTLVHYGDVALLAATLQDDLLAISLRRAYLSPLESTRDDGAEAKAMLRAYFAAAGNISSAAAALGIHRRTAASRLAAIEERLGRPLQVASAELETALRLDALEAARADR